jgi:hypothetical protein
MVFPTFDLTAIFWEALITFIIDTIIFLIFHVRNVTLIVNFIWTFIIPYLWLTFFINSNPPIEQGVFAATNYFVLSFFNLFSFVLSAAISYVISSIAYVASDGRTEKPEF